jgi:hypothetical protein
VYATGDWHDSGDTGVRSLSNKSVVWFDAFVIMCMRR